MAVDSSQFPLGGGGGGKRRSSGQPRRVVLRVSLADEPHEGGSDCSGGSRCQALASLLATQHREICLQESGLTGSGPIPNPKGSKSRDLSAIAICDSNRESQITSDLRQCEPSQKSPLL